MVSLNMISSMRNTFTIIIIPVKTQTFMISLFTETMHRQEILSPHPHSITATTDSISYFHDILMHIWGVGGGGS